MSDERSHSKQHWAFNVDGYMTLRDMSARDIAISARGRRINLGEEQREDKTMK